MRGATLRRRAYPRVRRDFNPRAPCGARRAGEPSLLWLIAISIHAPHAGRDERREAHNARRRRISIHAPHAGRDRKHLPKGHIQFWISIHAPHAGRDILDVVIGTTVSLFQSTRPMRGATTGAARPLAALLYFNPRAPCGARRWFSCCVRDRCHISIHAPHAGRDRKHLPKGHIQFWISIHAPHAGRDAAQST